MTDDINDVSHTSTLAKNNEAVRREALGDGVAQQRQLSRDAVYEVVLRELETKRRMPTSVSLAIAITDAVVALSPPRSGQMSNDIVETACAAYAKATGYYVEFHRGLSSASSDRMREGMRAALAAVSSPHSPGESINKDGLTEFIKKNCGYSAFEANALSLNILQKFDVRPK